MAASVWEVVLSIRQTVEFSAYLSAYSSHLIESYELGNRELHRCWEASRRRVIDLAGRLQEIRGFVPSEPQSERRRNWRAIRPVLEEVFVSEMLCRVWGAVLSAADRYRGTDQARNVVRNSLIQQLELRQRALRLLIDGLACTPGEVRDVDVLRRKLEHWTDMFVGHLVVRYGVGEFACDVERAREFGERPFPAAADGTFEAAWMLTLTGLRIAFNGAANEGPYGPYHHAFVDSIVALFPEEAFAAEGALRSPALARLFRSGFAPEGPPKPDVARGFAKLYDKATAPSVITDAGISFAAIRNKHRPD